MKAIETALTLTKAYKLAIERFEKMLGQGFVSAVTAMNETSEHIIVCGMGKSGLVGRKISATLASTGTPSIFLHPAEAIHGDLGKVHKKSVVLLISYSGETGEILALIPALKRLNVTIIALQCEAMNIPHIRKETKGEKEKELKFLLDYRFGPGTHQKVLDLRRQIKKEREETIYAAEEFKHAIIDGAIMVALSLGILGSIFLGVYFIGVVQTPPWW